MRRIIFVLLLSLIAAAEPSAAFRGGFTTNIAAVGQFSTLPVGGGGRVGFVDMQSDGTKVSVNDTYGAYIASGTGAWQQLVTKTSMPSGTNGLNTAFAQGAYVAVAAPTNTSHLYMHLGGFIFSSTNRGTGWTQAALAKDSSTFLCSSNSFACNYGGRNAAVDPANENIALIGTPGAIYMTSDGLTWAAISTSQIPAPTSSSQGSGIMVAFDPTSSVVGSATQGIFACSYGHGVYHTTNGGTTWTLTSGSPTTCSFMIVDVNGIVWLVDQSDGAGTGTGALNKLLSGTWSVAQTGGKSIHSVAVDPATPAHVFSATYSSGKLYVSTNTGGSFVGPTAISVTATDIPWLANAALDGQFTTDAIAFDPSGSNLLLNSNGIGVFKTNPPTTNVTVTWASQTLGIENLVLNGVNGIASGNPLVWGWDRPGFVLTPGTYPSVYGGGTFSNSSCGFGLGSAWGGDVDPTGAVAGIAATPAGNFGDCGSSSSTPIPSVSWALFGGAVTGAGQTPATTNNTSAGCFAASTTTHFLWMGLDTGSNTNRPWTTTNNGASWTQQTVGNSVPTTGPTGWGASYFNPVIFCAADKGGTADIYYLYNSGSTAPGTYRSTDGGVTWTKMSATNLLASASFAGAFQMKAVPGQASNLFAISGNQGASTQNSSVRMRQTTDGGTTWNTIANVTEVYCIGFGFAQSGSYPTVYFVGWVSGVYGVWKSIDNFATAPVKVGDGFPGGTLMPPKDCYGDMGVSGAMYSVTNGNGAYQGTGL